MFSYDTIPFVKFGYLHKQARKSRRNWKKRWVVVNLKQRHISYYKTQKEFDSHKKPAGTFGLPAADDTFVGPSSSTRSNSFEIYHIKKGSGKKETLLSLAADTVENMDKWVEMLEEVCQGNCRPASTTTSGGNSPRRKAPRYSAKDHIHAHQQRQSIVAMYGKSRRSVGIESAQVVAQVQVVGAGTHAADGMYRATRVVPNANIVAAYMSNDGYRLVLVDGGKGSRPQWKIIEPGDDRVLYVSNNVKDLFPAANDWHIEAGQNPPPVLQKIGVEHLPSEPQPPARLTGLRITTDHGDMDMDMNDVDAQEGKHGDQSNNDYHNAEETEKTLVFTKSFLGGERYNHVNLLKLGELPGTPVLKMSYAMLKGPYLNDALRALLPPWPVKGKSSSAVRRQASLNRPLPPPPSSRPPPTPGPPPGAVVPGHGTFDYEDDSQEDSSNDEPEDFYEYNKYNGRREQMEQEEKSKELPPPPSWTPPKTPGPPKRLPLPPPLFSAPSLPGPPPSSFLSGPPASLPGPPSSYSLPGPPTSLPGPPPQSSQTSAQHSPPTLPSGFHPPPVPGAPPAFVSTLPKKRSSVAPVALEHLPAAPPSLRGAAKRSSFGKSASPAFKKQRSNKNLRAPPAIPTLPAYVPNLERDRIRPSDGANRPAVPPMPSFVPGLSVAPVSKRNRSIRRKGKRSTGLEGLAMQSKKSMSRTLSKKGSLHVMHKTTAHTTAEVHRSHVPPHLRL